MERSDGQVGGRGTQQTSGNCRKIGRARHSWPSRAYIIAHDAAAICIKNLAENTSILAYRKLSTGGIARGGAAQLVEYRPGPFRKPR